MNLLSLVLLFLIGSQSLFLGVYHDFHLSRCDIIYNTEEKALQISLQLFIDDLEKALKSKGYENLGICTQKELPEAESYIYQYVADHLKLKVDGVSLVLDWVGKEVSDDLAGIWCYLEVYPEDPQQSISVQNDILVEIFADQRNIVKLIYLPDQRAHFLFDNEEIEGLLKINQ